jgi:hypothetical protein
LKIEQANKELTGISDYKFKC